MKIATIGHIDHGKTTLSEVILKFKELGNDIIVVDDEKGRGLTIAESVEQEKAIMFKALREYSGIKEVVKSGRENRRERRRKERKK
jgi:translation elongation factor EF-Tu-like GTPase